MLREHGSWDDEPNPSRSGMIVRVQGARVSSLGRSYVGTRFLTYRAFRAESGATAAFLRHRVFSRWISRFPRASLQGEALTGSFL